MKGMLVVAIGGVLLALGPAAAVPPAAGQHFDCSDGGSSSCATDDTGCVSNTSGHLKCSRALGRALAKAVSSVNKCHAKQASMRFKGASETGAGESEENCEENPGNSARGKLDATVAKLAGTGLCDPAQLAGAAAAEAEIFDPGPSSLDQLNAVVFCDPASGILIGDDDAGFVPNDAGGLKCALTVGKMWNRLNAAVAKCHDKMNSSFFKARDFDEELCEETDPVSHRGALDKYNQQRDKLAGLGICPPCLDSAALDAFAADVISHRDDTNAQIYPCTLGP